jgi:hypothetical protein
MAQTQLAQVEGMIEALQAAQSQVEAFSTASSGDAQASRAKIEQLLGQVNQTLSQIKTEADGPLATAYEGALTALNRAASNTAKAGSGGGPNANAAKMLNASIQEATARTHLSAARGIADRKAVMLKIKQAGGALPMNGLDAQIAELDSAGQKHIADAKAALDEARATLEGVTGGSSEVEAFRANLASLTNALSGNPAESTPPESAPPPATPPAGAAAPDAATSPEPGDTAPTEPATAETQPKPADAPGGGRLPV